MDIDHCTQRVNNNSCPLCGRTRSRASSPPADLPALLWWYGGRETRREISQLRNNWRNCCSARTRLRRGGRLRRAPPGHRTTRRPRPDDPGTMTLTPLSASRTTCDPSVHIPWPHVPWLRRAIDMCGTRYIIIPAGGVGAILYHTKYYVIVDAGGCVTALTSANPPRRPRSLLPLSPSRPLTTPPLTAPGRGAPRSFIIDTSRVSPSRHTSFEGFSALGIA